MDPEVRLLWTLLLLMANRKDFFATYLFSLGASSVIVTEKHELARINRQHLCHIKLRF